MTTLPGSTPSSVKMRSCARPTVDWMPWVVIAMPVCFAARAAARCARSSCALTHGPSVPISPMIPGLMPLSPTPCSSSRAISAAAAPAVGPQLLDHELVVGSELPVVPSVGDVPEADGGVLVREREAELVGWDRTGDGHDAGRHRASSLLRCP